MKPRILVIRGGAIGDFILTLPALSLLRENFPGAHLEIIGYRHIVALAEGRYYADAARSIEYGPMAGFFSRQADLSEELCAYFAGFQQVLSFLYDPDGIFEANLERAGVKNYLACYTKLDDSDHAARQLARPLERMALFLESSAARVFPSPSDAADAACHFPSINGGRLVAIHPGSGSPAKNWPAENWAELGRRLAGAGYHLLLVGGEADRHPMAALQQAWRGLALEVAQDLPLPTLAALLQSTEFFLGHDSGIGHLAAAVGCRCHLLFGPTDPDIWAPANPEVKVQQAPKGVMAHLPVEQVWQTLGIPK